MHKKWFRALFRRRIFIALMLLLQIAFLIYVIINTTRTSVYIAWGLKIISFFVVLYIVNKKDKGAYRLIWVMLILVFPIFGGLFYIFSHWQSTTRKFHKKLDEIESGSRNMFYLAGDSREKASETLPDRINQIKYLQSFAGFPVYSDTRTKYLPLGEVKFKYLVEELEKARKYIFLEYFIIQEGVMWNTVLDILKRKAKEGVDVRLLYDDMGCFFLLPKDYPKTLEDCGIKCRVFNKFMPFLTLMQNNRDHRKIAVIDGKVAFTGGINLADEYINAIEKHGHWKDSSVMLTGRAAWSLTVIFLQMWSLCARCEEDFSAYLPDFTSLPVFAYTQSNDSLTDNSGTASGNVPAHGFVQPYADSPTDSENVGEHVYMQIINSAKKYIYITTPYLIIDDSMISALTLAAKSGVDVKIITPHRWDKWFVHLTTRSYYRELISEGIEIYEYTDGFIHAKTFVSDDSVATVGTTNLDFRSLYLHFECGVCLYETEAVLEVRDDFLKTLERCHKIEPPDCRSNWFMRFVQEVLRVFAPLM